MRKLYLVALLLSLVACSPVKRFNRLVERHPELIRTDTIVRQDTVTFVVPEVKHDTAFIDRELRDTVYIEKDRLNIKLWQVHDTVHVEGECKSDTITVVREVEIPVYYYKDDYKWWHDIPWWVYILAAFTISILLYRRFKK